MIALTLAFSSSPVAAESRAIYPGSVFAGYGDNTGKTTKVYVSGDVLHAGDFHLPRGATLLDLLLRLGPSSGKAEFNPPHEILITVRDSEGKLRQEKHRFFKIPPEELRKIPIPPDSICYLPLRIL